LTIVYISLSFVHHRPHRRFLSSPIRTFPTTLHTLSLHDALPILLCDGSLGVGLAGGVDDADGLGIRQQLAYHLQLLLHRQLVARSEEHTSELQSRFDLVCRLLLEKRNSSTTD